MSSANPSSPGSARVQPTHERAVRAVKALDEGRVADAGTNAEAMGDSPIGDLAWKTYLLGRVQLEQGELQDAKQTLERAAALAQRFAKEIPSAAREAMRLSAEALEQLGRAFRRGERIVEAIRAHQVAYQLRCEHGSALEQWESAESVSLDQVLGGQGEESRVWCVRALGHARVAGVEYEARSRGLLAGILGKLNRWDEAVVEAKAAAELWRVHCPGDRRLFLAQKQVGNCLVQLAGGVLESDPPRAKAVLDEAIALLESACRELRAFGEDSISEVRECDELVDFARRLRGSLDTP